MTLLAVMKQFLCVLLWTHTAMAVFFHEQSPIVLAPVGDHISFGYSLGYQRGENASLVIGAPLYDQTGRVYQRSISEILNGTTTCDPLDIDFAALNITYNRSLSTEQHFYLGASIAATDNFFVTVAPLRTAYGNSEIKDGKATKTKFGAFGACFVYDQTKRARACQNYGLELSINRGTTITYPMYGGSGWSSMVDENRKRIFISKSFHKYDVSYSTFNPKQNYKSLKDISIANLPSTKTLVNYGKAMTFGNYFDTNVTNTYYAFSSRNMFGKGVIDVYSIDIWNATVCRFDDKGVGTMFGAAMSSCDVTGDNMADILVGAPAQVADARGFDRGAVHVLTKSDSANSQILVLKLTILAAHDGGRFGSTLSTNDVDGDSYHEIFVSAPFEKSGVGALYVLCGHETYTLLKKGIKIINLSQLERAQRIEMETQKSFGFSLQPVEDFNDNGSDELGVGAPDSSRVILFLGIPAVTVKVTSRFPNTKLDTDLGASANDFLSCFTVDLLPKQKNITTKLLVKNVLIGKGALNNTGDANYEIDLATENGTKVDGKLTEYCRQIRVVNASSYMINTTVSAVQDITEQKVFKNSWVTFSAQSNLTKLTPFECKCPSGGCGPDLLTQLQWSGGSQTDGKANYMVLSSYSETVNVVVRNNGTTGCGACAVVFVSGQLYNLQCESTDIARQYRCALPSPFPGNTSENFEIQVSMGSLSNKDNNLTIDVEVREDCNEPGNKTTLMVLYNFTNVLDNIILNGTSMDGVITDTDIQDESEEIILHEQSYTIHNNQSFTWTNIRVNVSASNKPYIQSFKVTIKQTDHYDEYNGTDDYFWQSTLTVMPYSAIGVTIYTTISKKELAGLLIQNGQNITLPSEVALDLLPDKSKNKKLTTVLTYRKEMTIWHNKRLITIIALCGALVALIIIAAILYKTKFFMRKNKEKLKKEIRRRSIRRESSRRRPLSEVSARARTSVCEGEDLVIVEECSPLRGADASEGAPAQAEGTTRTYSFE